MGAMSVGGAIEQAADVLAALVEVCEQPVKVL
jgi:hypothetical protein